MGDNILPSNWVRRRLGVESTQVINRTFFRFQGKLDLKLTEKCVFL